MTTAELLERDEQLVNMLRRDKGAFLQEYRRVFAIPESESLSGLLDREMIGAILDHEFPQQRSAARCQSK